MKIRNIVIFIPIFLVGVALTHGDTLKLSLEQAIALGLKNSATVKYGGLAVSSSLADVDAACAGYFPNISAAFSWSHMFNETEPTQMGTYEIYTSPSDPISISIEASQSLFSFGKIRNGVRIADESVRVAELNLEEEKRILGIQIERAFYGCIMAEETLKINNETLINKLEALEVNLDSLESIIKLNIENIMLAIAEGKQKISSGRKGVELARRLHNSATEQYAGGLISSLELKDAQLGLNSAQLAYLRMIYNYKMAIIDLKDAVGTESF